MRNNHFFLLLYPVLTFLSSKIGPNKSTVARDFRFTGNRRELDELRLTQTSALTLIKKLGKLNMTEVWAILYGNDISEKTSRVFFQNIMMINVP